MSRPQKLNNEESNKIFKDPSGPTLESAIQCCSAPINNRPEKLNNSNKPCRPTLAAHSSDGSIIKNQESTGLTQKLVSKVKSWSSKENKGLVQQIESTSTPKYDPNPSNIALELENLSLNNNMSEDAVYKSDLPRAKDSLENVIGSRSDKFRSFSHSSSAQGPHSDPALSGETSEATSRILTWDPWNKVGRKNKRENKRKRISDKSPNSPETIRVRSPIRHSIEHTVGDEPRASIAQGVEEPYEYQLYRPTRKSVEFVNEVVVMYFSGEEVVTKGTEPLKKELDQQIRNKEMRRGHVPCTMAGKQCSGEDYMASWFNK